MWVVKDYRNDVSHLKNVLNTFLKEREAKYAQADLPLNVYEDEEAVYVAAPLAGIKKEDIDLEYKYGTLNIKCKKNLKTEDAEFKLRMERGAGEFEREVELPQDVDASSIQAQFLNGLLLISFKKKEEAKPKKIEIA